MATLTNEYVHWQHKNNEALERIASLESQITTVRKQCENRHQQEIVVNKLKNQLKRYALMQSEYTLLIQKLNSRTRRIVRDTGHSETTTFTAPDIKASIAVKQLTSKIEALMTKQLSNDHIGDDLSGISVPIMALLQSSSVDSNMILHQMTKYLNHLHEQVQSQTQHPESDEIVQDIFSEKVQELELLCVEREAQTEKNIQKQQIYKYQADEIVRQMKTKIASNYPDDDVQRMVLKNILSKAQKQRYHKKIEQLQQAVADMEREHGNTGTDLYVTANNIKEQMDERQQTIEHLHFQIDVLNLKISQQLQRNKEIFNDDEAQLWNDIKERCRLLTDKFQKSTEMVSDHKEMQTKFNKTTDTSDSIQEVRRHLHCNSNMDLLSILREIQNLRIEAHSKLDMEGSINELYTRSKEKLDFLRAKLCERATGLKMNPDTALNSAAENFTEYMQKKQAEFWQDYHGQLVRHLEEHKKKAIDSIQQIQLCLDERNEMLQGELVMDINADSAA